ncbi:MAG: epoxyqueuosine reductase QueH [Patescibacteria group bacterium]
MKPKILLHACCAPCSIYVLQKLSADYQVTIYFYDPNIHPRQEYNKRRDELKKYAKKIGINFMEGPYNSADWLEKTKGLEKEPERGKRCEVCFDMRLAESARIAKDNGFDIWTTVLSISPHKDPKQINSVGQKIAGLIGLPYMPADWKKNDGFKIASRLSKEEGFYRQDYCGCVYSRPLFWRQKSGAKKRLAAKKSTEFVASSRDFSELALDPARAQTAEKLSQLSAAKF